MSELLKKQNYGVEVEFTGISRKMAADAVAEIIGTTASRPDHTCYQTRTIQDSQGRKWKVMRDSSINPIRKVGTENMDEYRVEFVTPVLKYEDLDTLQAIIRKFREIGGVPHASCGIHIHVDGANHTATSLRRLVNFMYSRQEIIYDALAVGSRKNRWCLPVCKNLLDTMKKDKNITTDSVEKIWYSPGLDGIFSSVYNLFGITCSTRSQPFPISSHRALLCSRMVPDGNSCTDISNSVDTFIIFICARLLSGI